MLVSTFSICMRKVSKICLYVWKRLISSLPRIKTLVAGFFFNLIFGYVCPSEIPYLSFHTVLCHMFRLFGTWDLFNISYSRELYLFSKFLHFEEIVRVKMAVCFEMIVSET